MVAVPCFNENVCKHFVTYLKFYGCHRDRADIMTKIGTMSYENRKYRLYERGSFGWWENEDRVMIVWCVNDDDESVMVFNYDTGKWQIEAERSDVYQLWYDKLTGWMNAEEGRTIEQMKEVGYEEIAAWVIEGDEVYEGQDDRAFIDTLFDDEILSVAYFFILLYFICILVVGTAAGQESATANTFDGFATDYYCDGDVCYFLDELD